MKNIITIDKLNFSYSGNKIFNNLELQIKEGEWLSIVGPNGSGKSTLIKLLVGLIDSNATITIDNLLLNKDNVMNIRKKIGVIFENPDNQFVAEIVRDDIAFSLENLNYESTEINNKINEIANLLNINHILDYKPNQLSGGEKQKIALASVLVFEPKIIILDEALSMINANDKIEILEILKKMHKEKGITVINATHDLDETLYGDKIVVLNKGKKVIEGKTLEVLKEDKILTKLGLELPFMVDLSIKLKFYNLIDDIILDMDDMIKNIWE
jgi:energy-coupling factor transport system ATP-binding protein